MSVQFVSFYLAHFEKNVKILFQKYFEENYFLFVIFKLFSGEFVIAKFVSNYQASILDKIDSFEILES